MRPLALVGIVSALGVASAHAQSNPSTQAQVTQAVTVVAKREPVVTVLAPRETPAAATTAKRRPMPAGIGKAVDANGDGLADAPAAAARAKDCGDKAPRTTQKSACAQSNPQYKDKTAQGQNPLREP
jgi:hypothetical protein